MDTHCGRLCIESENSAVRGNSVSDHVLDLKYKNGDDCWELHIDNVLKMLTHKC